MSWSKVDPALMARRKFVLLRGPVGAGKTLWAREFSRRQKLWPDSEPDSAALYRLAGIDREETRGLAAEDRSRDGLAYQYIFRAPHHTVSEAGMMGTLHRGWCPRPGELSLAHGGTLFLDELPEFRRTVLDRVLGAVRLGYVEYQTQECRVLLPACFSLVVSMNVCPCGWHGSTRYECRCSEEMIVRYAAQASPFEKFCEVVQLPSRAEA